MAAGTWQPDRPTDSRCKSLKF